MIKLKPCPYCGSTDLRLCEGLGYGVVECRVNDCFTKGPMKDDIRQAVAAWNALPRSLHLTENRPEKPGYYWYEWDHEKQPVYVFRGAPLHGKTTLYAQFFGEGDVVHKVSEMSGKWAGPIHEPENRP